MATEFSSARDRQCVPGAESSDGSSGDPASGSTSGRGAPAPDGRTPSGPTAPARLGEVLERISDALVALDAYGRCTYANARAAALFGRQPGELLGRDLGERFADGEAAALRQACEIALSRRTFLRFEHDYPAWGRCLEHRIHPSPDGVPIFLHEITARTRAETAALENASLVGKMSGQVPADSSRGAEATFSIELPDAAGRALPGGPAGRSAGR